MHKKPTVRHTVTAFELPRGLKRIKQGAPLGNLIVPRTHLSIGFLLLNVEFLHETEIWVHCGTGANKS